MGKARTFSNEGEEANYLKESEDETYSSTQQNSYNLGSTTFSDQSGIGNFAQSGTDQRKANLTGALFRGNIGFLLQTALLDVSDNTINLLFDENGDAVSDVSSDRIVTISGGGNTSDLEIILGAQRPGQRLILYNIDGNTITIKDASAATSPTDSNLIHTPGGLDYIVSGFDSVALTYDSDLSQWRIMGAVGTGGGTGYNLIQDEGISLTQRTTMNFIGTAVTAVDNPGQTRTDITINTGTGTIPSGTAENQHLEWDNSGLTWTVVDFLTMGAFGPFASTGLIRTANDQFVISSRNVGDSGDIAVKVNSSDKFIFEFPGAVVPLEISFNEIDVKTVDIINIDRAKFVTSSGSMVPSDTTGILRNSNSQFQFNTSETSDFTFTFDNNDPSFVIDRDTSDNDNTLVSLLSNETDINSASFLNIVKNFPIPVSLQEIGHLNFIAGNSAGSTLFEYASIIGKIEDTTNGSIEGSMIFNATVNDSITPFVILNNASNGIIEALRDVTLVNTISNPVLTLFRDQTGVTDNLLGNIIFKGQTASGGDFTYSSISSTISDATLGQEDSIITLIATNNGLFGNVRLIVNADSSQILRFESVAPDANVVTPVFELLSTSQVTPTGVRNIGDIDFIATTNDGGGVGAAETFAQIIVDQEDPDINNESGSMRFRVRDQSGTAGSIKTYLRFNDGNNGRIDALKDLAMIGNDVIGVQAIGFNEIGGQIAVADDSAGFNFVTTSDRPFRFTPNATNVLDIDDTGLTMLSGNIELGNGNVTGVNQIAFNVANQTITDDFNGLRYSLPDTLDTHDFIIDSNTPVSIEKFFLNLSNTRIQMTQEIDPASPVAGDVFFYAKLSDGIAKLFYKQSDGTVIGPLGIGGGGGTGGGVVGESIVKANEDPITNDTTLTIDDEFQFIPEANTIYFIEWNIRYDSSFTQIKVAVEGGADMSYQIVAYNTNTIPNNWSDPSLSNVEFLPFASTGSSTEEDSHSVQFYAIVTVGNDTDAIGLSWAQLSSNPSQTVIRVGSLMRIFAEGVNGGGSGEINDYTVTNTQASDPNDGYLDVNDDFIGNNNGFENLNISLGTSNPGSPTTTITISLSDIPQFSPIENVLEYVSFGVIMSGVCKNSGSSTRAIVQGYVNGSPNSDAPFTSVNVTTNGNNAQVTAFMSDESVGLGDVIGLACWTDGGTGMDLEDVALWVFPTVIKLLGRNFQLVFPGTAPNPSFETFMITGNNPAGISNNASGGFFERFQINGPAPNTVSNEWYSDHTQLVQGGELKTEDGGFSTNFARNSNASDDLFSASMEGFRFLRFVR